MASRRSTQIFLYDLLRREGVKAQLRRAGDYSLDTETGAKESTYELVTISKVLVVAQSKFKTLIQDLAYIAGAKNFTSGGYFNKAEVTVIIPKRRLPEAPKIDDDLIIEGIVYGIVRLPNDFGVRGFWSIAVTANSGGETQ